MASSANWQSLSKHVNGNGIVYVRLLMLLIGSVLGINVTQQQQVLEHIQQNTDKLNLNQSSFSRQINQIVNEDNFNVTFSDLIDLTNYLNKHEKFWDDLTEDDIDNFLLQREIKNQRRNN